MKKQTAVEWLIDVLRSQIEQGTLDAIAISKLKLYAKDIEKEQIIEAYNKGEFNQGCNGDAEQFYNQKYK